MGRYDVQWERYRRSRNAALLAFFGLLPFCVLLSELNPLIPSDILGLLMIPYLILIMVTSTRVGGFRCPRCGERFFRTWWYSATVLNNRCLHCGLEKFTNGEPSET
jgi:Zn ribbon nucleic-acid-binding protein